MRKLAEMKVHTDFEVVDNPMPTFAPGSSKSTPITCPAAHTTRPSPERYFPVYMAALPNGRRVPILKTLLTSVCERNCNYCFSRASRDFRRQTFQPEELAHAFLNLHNGGVVDGIFLSSGVAGSSIQTQDRLLDTAEILREKLNYRGYIHLKIMPGAEYDQVFRAMQLADRVSVNLEAPNTKRLKRLAPQKTFMQELLQPLRWVDQIRQNHPAHQGWNGRWSSSTTQFVAGGGGESDLELISTTAYLYKHLRLARAYFSAFTPIKDTPLEGQPPLNLWRQHRLYQASFLLKHYPFELEELPFSPSGNLPLDIDPKLAWARANLNGQPVEINKAGRQELLRIPGIGPHYARLIVSARRKNTLSSLENLKALGIKTSRLAPFILMNGRRPPRQLALW